MKSYLGVRHHDYNPVTRDCISVSVVSGDKKAPLRNYFPVKTAFDMPLDWGKNHGGFASTNLSASILADYLCIGEVEYETNKGLPKELIFGFRDCVLRNLDWKDWILSEEIVSEFVEEYICAREEAIDAQFEASDNWEEEEALNELVFPSNYGSGFSADFDEYRGGDS